MYLKLGIIPVFDETLDLCSVLNDADLKCPYGPTNTTTTESFTTNENLPSIGVSVCICECECDDVVSLMQGHITGDAIVTDQNGNQIACVDIDFDL